MGSNRNLYRSDFTRMAQRYGVEPDLIDYDALWDENLSPRENFRILEKHVKILSGKKEEKLRRAREEQLDQARWEAEAAGSDDASGEKVKPEDVPELVESAEGYDYPAGGEKYEGRAVSESISNRPFDVKATAKAVGGAASVAGKLIELGAKAAGSWLKGAEKKAQPVVEKTIKRAELETRKTPAYLQAYVKARNERIKGMNLETGKLAGLLLGQGGSAPVGSSGISRMLTGQGGGGTSSSVLSRLLLQKRRVGNQIIITQREDAQPQQQPEAPSGVATMLTGGSPSVGVWRAPRERSVLERLSGSERPRAGFAARKAPVARSLLERKLFGSKRKAGGFSLGSGISKMLKGGSKLRFSGGNSRIGQLALRSFRKKRGGMKWA